MDFCAEMEREQLESHCYGGSVPVDDRIVLKDAIDPIPVPSGAG